MDHREMQREVDRHVQLCGASVRCHLKAFATGTSSAVYRHRIPEIFTNNAGFEEGVTKHALLGQYAFIDVSVKNHELRNERPE